MLLPPNPTTNLVHFHLFPLLFQATTDDDDRASLVSAVPPSSKGTNFCVCSAHIPRIPVKNIWKNKEVFIGNLENGCFTSGGGRGHLGAAA